MSKPFFYRIMGKLYGPITGVKLREKAVEGTVLPDTPVCIGSKGEWVVASRLRGLFDIHGKPIPHPKTESAFQPLQSPPEAAKPAESTARINPNLRPCPGCGKMVSKRATQCPACGCPQPESDPRCPKCGFAFGWDGHKCSHCGNVGGESQVPRVRRRPRVQCPRCSSTDLSANKKGYGLGKAAAGGILLGPVGLLGGLIGSGKVVITCLSCGHAWEVRN